VAQVEHGLVGLINLVEDHIAEELDDVPVTRL
jgi:hypothetical protein